MRMDGKILPPEARTIKAMPVVLKLSGLEKTTAK